MYNTLERHFVGNTAGAGVTVTPAVESAFVSYWMQPRNLATLKGTIVTSNRLSLGTSRRSCQTPAGMANLLKGVKEDMYIMRSVKQTILQCVMLGYTHTHDVKGVAAANGLYSRDMLFVTRMVNCPQVNTTIKDAVGDNEFTPVTPQALNTLLDALTNSKTIADYRAKFVHKKMKFIAANSHRSIQDLDTELHDRGILGVLLKIPEISSMQHAEATYCYCLKKAGIGVIEAYTSPKTGELMKDNRGQFISRKKLIGSYENGLLPQSLEPGTGITGEGPGAIEKDPVIKQAVTDALVLVDEPVASRYMHIMMGHHDAEFDAWFCSEQTQWSDKDDPVGAFHASCLQTGQFNRFKNKVIKFLGLSSKDSDRVLMKLKANLGDRVVL